ncbi:sulfatase-like hydrolase/transferase [Catenovulum adriaticum]|uniref:Sulfatase-like hydrolase/transferase n=1 Tax=Catenovulum adriaticum TaxID=2984846 RepID=A0ABY7ANK9_9ALTE|nr:sulfatase-like hydrolase/transferase [Catenovulum sp. TS8]WAJ70808.1 sulfatase-like hydrolase/transferase [Catenovulum sp. TS8]
MNKLAVTLFTALILAGCNTSKHIPDTDNTDNLNNGNTTPETASSKPNILLIISDDQGLDASAQYNYSLDLPNTPTLDSIAQNGIIFDNMWTTPACATSRAQILTGKHGIHTGVNSVPASLSLTEQSIQSYLKSQAATQDYQTGFFGKWHLSPADEAARPNQFGVDYYAGSLTNLSSYTDWTLTVNGEQTQQTQYHTQKITDLAINWIKQQPADTPLV